MFSSRLASKFSIRGSQCGKRAFTESHAKPNRKAIFPQSMKDQYQILPSQQVPQGIVRPDYVGKRNQIFPSLTGNIHILNKKQIEGLKSASQLAAKTLKHAMDKAEVGMSLDELDKIVHDYIVADGSYPSAIDFMHFPKSVCLSVNDVVSHGVPNTYVLKAGDYLNIDVVCYKDGHHGDNSAMVFLEDDTTAVHPEIKRLSRVTRESMFVAIEHCKPGLRFDKIGGIIEDYAGEHGYYVNEMFGGHGIAHSLHMAPLVHHNRTPAACRAEMRPGMAFTIEPILHLKKEKNYYQFNDGWTMQAPGNHSC